ncbi:hypothetical protein BGZ98_000415, partial [Dissophora globulifera]
MPRPVRSVAKNVQYKTKKPKSRTGRPKRDGGDDHDDSFGDEDDDDEEHENLQEDDDDSDEYVEPATDTKVNDEDDEDDKMSVDEDEDEDDEDDDKDQKRSTRKHRRRKHMQTFALSLDEMNKLLVPRTDQGQAQGDSGTADDAASYGGALEIRKAVIQPKAPAPKKKKAQSNATNANNNSNTGATSSSKVHKKGEMHNSDLIPPTWKFAYQAPTSEDVTRVSMQEDALRSTVYRNMGCNVADFTILEKSESNQDLAEYMPTSATTTVHERDETFELPIMTSHYVPNTERTGINDCYILNTGFSVWAMDWCPLASDTTTDVVHDVDYVAIGGLPETAEICMTQDQIYPLGKQDAHANMIQLWSMNCRTNREGELQGEPKAHLDMCILHHYGAVLDMKWCPTGCFMEAGSEAGDISRLGILAAAFTDGTIRIFSVPDPRSLRHHLEKVVSSGTQHDTIYIQYPDPFVTLRLGDVNFMSINWGTAHRLAAGVTNGTIAVWDMQTMLSQSKKTLAEKDSEYLDPIFLPQVHDVCVRRVDWLRSPDPEEIPWIISTSGYDGHTRYTDLRDPFNQIDIKTILGLPMASISIPWAEGTVYVDIDFGAKIDQLYLESRGFRLFNSKGTIWDFSYSDYQPFLAAAMSDGRVKLTNPAYKAKRGFGMIQNHIYQLQEAPSTSSKGDAGQPQEKRDQSLCYIEGEEKEYSSKTDGFLNFYGYNVAVQKVQWSKRYSSAAWLASGSAGGLVRVDNTMLRRDEGGTGNKIKYAAEPYVVKKKSAGYDIEGRKLGQDGTPVKLGRPRKPEAETYRGRLAIAKRLQAEKAAAAAAGVAGEATPQDNETQTTTSAVTSTQPTRASRTQKGKGKKKDKGDESEEDGEGWREDNEGEDEEADYEPAKRAGKQASASGGKLAPIFSQARSTRRSTAPQPTEAGEEGASSIAATAASAVVVVDADGDVEMAEVGSEKSKKPRGRPRKVALGDAASGSGPGPGAVKAAKTGAAATKLVSRQESAAASATAAEEPSEEAEVAGPSSSRPSSRASSVASDSPRGKQGAGAG